VFEKTSTRRELKDCKLSSTLKFLLPVTFIDGKHGGLMVIAHSKLSRVKL